MSLEEEVKHLIVDALMLEDVVAASIDPEAPLFVEGLGLDSIDALELAIAIDRVYGVRLESKDERNREIFRNVRALAAHVAAHRTR